MGVAVQYKSDGASFGQTWTNRVSSRGKILEFRQTQTQCDTILIQLLLLMYHSLEVMQQAHSTHHEVPFIHRETDRIPGQAIIFQLSIDRIL
jgi:hypothetical protein